MFTELFTWQVLLIIGIIWLFTDFAWISRWKDLLSRISKLFSAPWVFAKDPTPDRHPAYPREFMEQLAQADLPAAKADDGSVNSLTHWWKSLSSRVLGEVSPLISIGHVLSLVFFVFFIYADAVTVANTLVLIGVQSPDLPHLLTRLDLAILGGALVSATVGVWIMVEMLGKGEFISTADMTKGQKRVYGTIAFMVIIFSMLVMLALAGQRMISLGIYASTPQLEFLISFTLYGLLAINSSLAAALTFTAGAQGIVVLFILVGAIISLVMPILVFVLDLVWRIVVGVLDVVFWFLLTPFMAIPYGISRLFGAGKGKAEG
ncbi:hypothetical protein ACFLXB_08445 [Chloroflexota bacterium]